MEKQPTDSQTKASQWLGEIARYEKAFAKWFERANRINEKYVDERNLEDERNNRRYAMLWANTETLKPAVYAVSPNPAVTRRFKDPDPVARVASEVLERAISYSLDKMGFDGAMKNVRDNYLLYARGQLWFRYEADLTPVTSDEPEKIKGERVKADFLHRRDFLHGPGRCWDEVAWVGRRAFMGTKAIAKRFGKDIADAISQAKESRTDKEDAQQLDDHDSGPNKKTPIYEIWDKASKRVYWVCRSYPKLLDEKPPMLDVEGFFPCPMPCYGTHSTENLIPVPDYIFYQDQAEEIDDLTARIGQLTDSLKLVGFYPSGEDGGSKAIEMAAKPETQSQMIPVPGWAMFSERGGSTAIQWWPVDMVIKVMEGCILLRKQLIEDIYQITGIADIMRGATDATETLGAQQLKAQWGSTRIRDRQAEIQRFVRDCCCIVGEVIAEKFQPKSIQDMTGIQLEPEKVPFVIPMMDPTGQMQQQAGQIEQKNAQKAQIVKLLRDDRQRGFKIDIETDSTIEPDENAAKEAATEFLTAIGGFIEKALPIVQAEPGLLPMVGEMLKSYARKFRAGRELEDVIERAIDDLGKAAQQPQEPPPDPAMIEGQMKAQAHQEKMQMDKQSASASMQMDAQKQQHEQALKAQELKFKMELEREKLQTTAQLEEIKIRSQIALKEFEVEQNAILKAEEADRSAVEGHERQEREAKQDAGNGEMQQILTDLQQLIGQLSAPKQINVQRDPAGQITGAEQRVVN